jgi:hypothetical protein
MDENRKKATIAVLVLIVIAVLLLFGPSIIKKFATLTLENAYIVSQQEGNKFATNQPKLVGKGANVMLFAVLEAKKKFSSKPVYFASAPAIAIDGKNIPEDQLEKWDPKRWGEISINWYKIEPVLPTSDKSQPLELANLGYQESLLSDWGSVWEHKADVAPVITPYGASYPDYPTDVGTMRYKVTLELKGSAAGAGKTVVSPGANAKDSIGLTDNVHRVTVRGDDSYAGQLMGLFHIPFTKGTVDPALLAKSMERYLGGTTPSFVVGGYVIKGFKNVDFTMGGFMDHSNSVLEKVVQDESDGYIYKVEETRTRFRAKKKEVRTNLTVGQDVLLGDVFMDENGNMAVFYKQAKGGEKPEALKRDDLVIAAVNFSPVIDKVSNVFPGDFSIRRLTD